MTSLDQRDANRANAAKSTGPRTSEGKAVSRANALKHGCRATTVLLEGEDHDLLEALRLGLIEELAPESAMEMELADRLVTLVWRSRRIATFETAIFAWMGHWSGEYYDLDGYDKGWNGKSERFQRFHQGLHRPDKKRSPEHHKKLLLGRLLHEEMNHDLIAKLSRYESHILNQLRRTHADLLALQTRRRLEGEKMADAAVDVDMHLRTSTSRSPYIDSKRSLSK